MPIAQEARFVPIRASPWPVSPSHSRRADLSVLGSVHSGGGGGLRMFALRPTSGVRSQRTQPHIKTVREGPLAFVLVSRNPSAPARLPFSPDRGRLALRSFAAATTTPAHNAPCGISADVAVAGLDLQVYNCRYAHRLSSLSLCRLPSSSSFVFTFTRSAPASFIPALSCTSFFPSSFW